MSDTQEILQRALMRLKARRGGFAPMPEFGSRLHELCGIKKNQREFYAKQFVFEALSPEKELSVIEVEYSENEDGTGTVNALLKLGDSNLTLNVSV